MPFTFLSHQAPVLPLKLAAPRWVDGTALAIGSTAPDLVFVLRGTALYVDAHTVWPQVWLCLPLTVALTWLVKRHVAAVLAPHLPEAGRFHLTDYRLLGGWPGPRGLRGWLIISGSALVGCFSHLVLDSFTHGFGWAAQRLGPLGVEVLTLPPRLSGRAVYVYDLLQIGGTTIGAAVTVACLHHIGRHRSLRRWYPTTPSPSPTRRSRRRLLTATTAGVAAGIFVAALTRDVGGMQALIIRAAGLAFIGLLVGCAAARPAMREPAEVRTALSASCR